MTDGVRTERLRELVWIAFALAIAPNTVEAFGVGPAGDWWQALRFGLSTVFAITLLAWVASRLGERRRR